MSIVGLLIRFFSESVEDSEAVGGGHGLLPKNQNNRSLESFKQEQDSEYDHNNKTYSGGILCCNGDQCPGRFWAQSINRDPSV
jgi:hypothetical protein